jgi:ABC-type multidrug transport system ATPase subunit
LSTHILEIAHDFCDRVGILSDGRLASEEEGPARSMRDFEHFVLSTMSGATDVAERGAES